MRTSYFKHCFAAALASGLLAPGGFPTCGRAQVFTLDTNQSAITISGSVVGGAITNQGPGSLTATIGGTLQVALAGVTIQFTGQSEILAQTNGSWQPLADGSAGSAPADFGGKATTALGSGVAALRNIRLDVISPAINLNGGQFDSTSLTFFFPSNSLSSLAYNVAGIFSTKGALAMTGYATNKVTASSSLTASGTQQTLTIPVDATFYLKLLSANDVVIRLQGQLVAVEGSQAGLEVQSLAVQNQSVVLQWQSDAGQQFQIQSSSNLSSWHTNATITSTSGANSWTGAVSGSVSFFRLAK